MQGILGAFWHGLNVMKTRSFVHYMRGDDVVNDVKVYC